MSKFYKQKEEVIHVCKYLEKALVFDNQNRVKFCPYYDIGTADEKLDGIWLNIEKINEKRKELNDNVPGKCNFCNFKSQSHKNSNNLQIETLYLSNWHFCYVNCNYCKYPKIENLIEAGHYDIFPYIKELIDKKLVTQKTKIIFECLSIRSRISPE